MCPATSPRAASLEPLPFALMISSENLSRSSTGSDAAVQRSDKDTFIDLRECHRREQLHFGHLRLLSLQCSSHGEADAKSSLDRSGQLETAGDVEAFRMGISNN